MADLGKEPVRVLIPSSLQDDTRFIFGLKGSMILFFSNGFTQAIACIIDTTPNGDAKTLLLNGFPFERVR